MRKEAYFLMVYILLANGFEETEAIAPYDVLKRGGAQVQFAGIGGELITSSHGVTVKTDILVEDIDAESAEMIVCPGGLVGVDNIIASDTAMKKIRECHDAGKLTAAICAGPAILARLGILEGKKAVCFPGLEGRMTGATISQAEPTVRDGNVITGRGAGASIDFGLRLLAELKGAEAAVKVAADIHYART